MFDTPYVLIMAGGIGSRFWPASREHLPKQFLDITGSGKTFIQQTLDRFKKFIPEDHIYIITHELYREQTMNAMPGFPAENIITEPTRNNTAASIAYASMKLVQKNKDAVCIVAPADHIIRDESEFKRVVLLAVEHADKNQSIVTLGITPTRPDTGYGYIEFEKDDQAEIRKVKSFREKPDAEKAAEYVKAGNYAWNSGIFIWRLDAVIDSFKMHATDIHDILMRGKDFYNTENEAGFINSEYSKTESISVDYAILEKAENVYTIPCSIGWSDLGTWSSLYEQSQKDDSQNALLSKPILLEETTNSLILSKNSKLVVIKGLDNFIVVDTDDCLLIYPKSEEQGIKALKEKLRDQGFDNYL